MPVYRFRCEKCSSFSEKLFLHKVDVSVDQQVEEFTANRCSCSGELIRVFSAPNLKFVGKDFYVTEERARREKERVSNDIRTAKENIAKSERKGGEAKGA